MEILHVSAECYPMAKAGGLGDVVGALPKYQASHGQIAKVVMPMYRTKFLYENDWEVVHESGTYMGGEWFRYAVIKESTNKLGFDLYLVDINGLLDREKVYGYADDTRRFVAFQIAVMHWMGQWAHQPDVVHCHDYHTGLLPFMLKHCFGFAHLRNIRTVLTIHNAQYQGWMGWNESYLIPRYDDWKSGLLDWNGMVNPLACAIRCADKVTTVSPSYMAELRSNANGLEALFEYERGKCSGILNGIDTEVWNPADDPYLEDHYTEDYVTEGKAMNKRFLCSRFGLDESKPLVVFIGRLVGEKAAEILGSTIGLSIEANNGNVNFLVLGNGEPQIEFELTNLLNIVPKNFNCFIGYSEQLAHRCYAGADFLIMPSRVEPCGLNQMYAMRYGTVPMVRRTGGLQDTVMDIGEPGGQGFGLCFDNATVDDAVIAVNRAVSWYYQAPEIFANARIKMMQIDHSWEKSAQRYIDLYSGLLGIEETINKAPVVAKPPKVTEPESPGMIPELPNDVVESQPPPRRMIRQKSHIKKPAPDTTEQNAATSQDLNFLTP